jgi:hypothetical protein
LPFSSSARRSGTSATTDADTIERNTSAAIRELASQLHLGFVEWEQDSPAQEVLREVEERVASYERRRLKRAPRKLVRTHQKLEVFPPEFFVGEGLKSLAQLTQVITH